MGERQRRHFGNVRRLKSGRWQARYRHEGTWYTAGTFACQCDPADTPSAPEKCKGAERCKGWRRAAAELGRIERDMEAGRWTPPVKAKTAKPNTFREYADAWAVERDLSATTRDHYAQLLRDHIHPTFGDVPVTDMNDPSQIRVWYSRLPETKHPKTGKKVGPVARAHAYGLLRTILNTAVADDLIPANPCRIRGGGRAKTTKKMRPASLDELAVIVRETPVRYRLMVQLAVWCSLRFGELAELRRFDVDVKHAVLRVRRGMTRTSSGRLVKTPKTEAGIRDVTIPSHILDDLEAHLSEHAQPGPDGLLFPASTHGGHLVPSSVYRWFYPAREAAGRPDLRFHDLRHTGQTYAAAMGANLRELMARAGQSSPGAALRYLHEMDGRQREIADALAGFAQQSNVVPIKAAASKGTRQRKEAASK